MGSQRSVMNKHAAINIFLSDPSGLVLAETERLAVVLCVLLCCVCFKSIVVTIIIHFSNTVLDVVSPWLLEVCTPFICCLF